MFGGIARSGVAWVASGPRKAVRGLEIGEIGDICMSGGIARSGAAWVASGHRKTVRGLEIGEI